MVGRRTGDGDDVRRADGGGGRGGVRGLDARERAVVSCQPWRESDSVLAPNELRREGPNSCEATDATEGGQGRVVRRLARERRFASPERPRGAIGVPCKRRCGAKPNIALIGSHRDQNAMYRNGWRFMSRRSESSDGAIALTERAIAESARIRPNRAVRVRRELRGARRARRGRAERPWTASNRAETGRASDGSMPTSVRMESADAIARDADVSPGAQIAPCQSERCPSESLHVPRAAAASSRAIGPRRRLAVVQSERSQRAFGALELGAEQLHVLDDPGELFRGERGVGRQPSKSGCSVARSVSPSATAG